jgi:hypothetical protein
MKNDWKEIIAFEKMKGEKNFQDALLQGVPNIQERKF